MCNSYSIILYILDSYEVSFGVRETIKDLKIKLIYKLCAYTHI